MSESGDAGFPEFYGFSENPFNRTPDLRFLFLSSSHKECLDSILSALEEKKGLLSLLGEAGTGKTFLTHFLIKRLEKNFNPVFISSYPGIPFDDLLRNMDPAQAAGEEEPFADLEKGGENRRSRNAVLFLDEAQNATREILGRLEELPGFEGNSLQIVFVGHPEFEEVLESESLKALSERIRFRCRIRPLSRVESEDYIEHHLNLVGSAGSEIFLPRALGLICRHGKGVPQNINTICENVLWIGYRRGRRKIDAAIVREALDQMHASERILFYQEAMADFSSRVKARLGPGAMGSWRKLESAAVFMNARRRAFVRTIPDVRPAWFWLRRAGRFSIDAAGKWGNSKAFVCAEKLRGFQGSFRSIANSSAAFEPMRRKISTLLTPFRSLSPWLAARAQKGWRAFPERLAAPREYISSVAVLSAALEARLRAGRQQLSFLRPSLHAAAQKAGAAIRILESSIPPLRPGPGKARKISYAAAPAAVFLLFLSLFLSRDYRENSIPKVELPSLLPVQADFSKGIISNEIISSSPVAVKKDAPRQIAKSQPPPPAGKRTPAAAAEKEKVARKTSPPPAEKKTEKKISAPVSHPVVTAPTKRQPPSTMERLPVIKRAALVTIESTAPSRPSEKHGFDSARTGTTEPARAPAMKNGEEPATLDKRTPVIHRAFAAKEIRPGDTWKIYLEASAKNGDMSSIFAVIERGNSFPSITRIEEKNRKHFAGFIFLKTLNTAAPFALTNLTLKVWIQDAAGHFSEPVVFPLRFESSSRPEQPPPGLFSEENLGPIMVQLVPSGVDGG